MLFRSIRIDLATIEQAHAAEQTALLEIERLNQVFSTYSPESELSQLNRLEIGQSQVVSADLHRLLTESIDWQHKTRSAFHPGAESLCELWKAAAKRNELPTDAELARVVSSLASPAWEWESNLSVRKSTAYRVGLNAIAEGYILDRVFELLSTRFRPQSLLINLGGEVRCGGKSAQVAIRNPRATATNAKPLLELALDGEAVATSGGYHQIGRAHV